MRWKRWQSRLPTPARFASGTQPVTAARVLPLESVHVSSRTDVRRAQSASDYLSTESVEQFPSQLDRGDQQRREDRNNRDDDQ